MFTLSYAITMRVVTYRHTADIPVFRFGISHFDSLELYVPVVIHAALDKAEI